MLGQWVQCSFYLPPIHLSAKQRGTSCYRRAASSLPASKKALPGCREKQILPKSKQKSHTSTASWRHTHLRKRGASPAVLPGPRHHFSTSCNLGMCLLPLLPRALAHYVTHLLCLDHLQRSFFTSVSSQAASRHQNPMKTHPTPEFLLCNYLCPLGSEALAYCGQHPPPGPELTISFSLQLSNGLP